MGRAFPRFRKETSRKTEAYSISIGERTYFISYETIVAYAGPAIHEDGSVERGIRIRRARSYSSVTAKHMREMGVEGWSQVPDEEFERMASFWTASHDPEVKPVEPPAEPPKPADKVDWG